MSKILDQFNKSQLKTVPDIRPGDTIKVHQKVKEGNKERIQVFEGIVIARKHGKGVSATITVRKVIDGVGVERVFPIHSPSLDKIEVAKHGKVRRAKLYYLRTAKGRKARLKNKEFATAIAEPDQSPSDIETGKEPAEPAEISEEDSGAPATISEPARHDAEASGGEANLGGEEAPVETSETEEK